MCGKNYENVRGNKKMLTFAGKKELHYKKAITGPQFREEVRSTSNSIAKKFVLAYTVLFTVPVNR
jgi:hypothetical protein